MECQGWPLTRHFEWWHLRDGEPVVIRPAVASDTGRLQEFVSGIERRTRSTALRGRATPPCLRVASDLVDSRRRLLLAIARRNEKEMIVGAACFAASGVATPEVDADFYVIVAHEAQCAGIGAKLLSCLLELSRRSRLRSLASDVAPTEHAILALAKRFGFAIAQSSSNPSLLRIAKGLRVGRHERQRCESP